MPISAKDILIITWIVVRRGNNHLDCKKSKNMPHQHSWVESATNIHRLFQFLSKKVDLKYKTAYCLQGKEEA